MGVVYIVGGGAHIQERVRTLVRQALAGDAAFAAWQCLPAGEEPRAAEDVCTGPVAVIYLDDLTDAPGDDSASAGQACADDDAVSKRGHGALHARLRVVLESLAESGASVGDAVDSVHVLRAGDAAAFAPWLRLGLALAQARYEREQSRRILSDALLDARAKWATDIHNGPIQELVGATFLLNVIPDGAGEPALTQIQTALRNLRQICQTLKPPALRDFGLGPALRAAIQAHPDLEPALDFDPDLPELDSRTRAVLFAIADLALRSLSGDKEGEPATDASLEAAVGDSAAGEPRLVVQLVSLIGEEAPAQVGGGTEKFVRFSLAWHAVEHEARLEARDEAVDSAEDSAEDPAEDSEAALAQPSTSPISSTALESILPLVRQLAYAVGGDISWVCNEQAEDLDPGAQDEADPRPDHDPACVGTCFELSVRVPHRVATDAGVADADATDADATDADATDADATDAVAPDRA